MAEEALITVAGSVSAAGSQRLIGVALRYGEGAGGGMQGALLALRGPETLHSARTRANRARILSWWTEADATTSCAIEQAVHPDYKSGALAQELDRVARGMSVGM